MRSLSPDEVPEDLARSALRNGTEMVWKQEDCAATIAWLRSVGRAILGTELWSVVDGNIYTRFEQKRVRQSTVRLVTR